MAANGYGNFGLNLLRGNVDVDTDTFKAMLVGSGYTYDADHDFRDDVTGEVTGTGYTAGGVSLTGLTTTYDAATNRVKLDAADASFGTVTLTGITGLVVYVSKGSAATDLLVSFHSFAAQAPSGVPFTYAWGTDGILTIGV
jgi:hypothetical protein